MLLPRDEIPLSLALLLTGAGLLLATALGWLP